MTYPTTLRRALLALSLSGVLGGVLAQAPSRPTGVAPPARLEAFDAPRALSYEERIRKQRLGGHYIPADINDAMRELEDITSVTSQNAYAERDEDFAVRRLYFSFGRWLGVNWSLYEGSRLSAYLNDLGVDAPDGQIEMLMRLYHRHLNGKPLDVKQLAEGYKAEKAAAERVPDRDTTAAEPYDLPSATLGNGNRRGG